MSSFRLKTRHLIPILSVALSLIGLVFIYSASSYSAELTYGDPFFYVKKQGIALGAGIILSVFASFIRPEWIKKIKFVVLGAALLLLAMVFIPGLGVESYGATRWINLGFTTLQPSEPAKFLLMLFLSAHMADHPPDSIKNLIVPLLTGGATCLLIMAEPNMSVTVCVGVCLLLMIFIAGSKKRWFVLLLALVLAAVPVLILLEPYRIKRIIAFIDPWENPLGEGYQLIQSYYAIGSGGLFGVGLFKSRQKYLFLPFSESDFIFSVVAEETGLFGCIFLIALFTMLVVIGIQVSMRCRDRLTSLLSFGIVAVIAVQTLINIAVVTGSIPPTGLPLPFLSAGGTSLTTNLFFTGLLYGIARRNDENSHSLVRDQRSEGMLRYVTKTNPSP